jgi:hypothetical protein
MEEAWVVVVHGEVAVGVPHLYHLAVLVYYLVEDPAHHPFFLQNVHFSIYQILMEIALESMSNQHSKNPNQCNKIFSSAWIVIFLGQKCCKESIYPSSMYIYYWTFCMQ